MKKIPFQVIPGGLSPQKESSERIFSGAWVTNTRLMGVVTLCVHWKRLREENDTIDDYQYFYYDAEEYGLDRFESFSEGSLEEQEELESSLIGGLGGYKVALSQREAIFLAQRFIEFNFFHDIPLPEEADQFLFLMEMENDLTQDEAENLFGKMCVGINSKYLLANYFLMRCFGADERAARFLATPSLLVSEFLPAYPGTFYRNQVDLAEDKGSCRCESLVELDDGYHIIVTELFFEQDRVSNVHVISDLAISDREAYLNLNHSEFVTVYQLKEDAQKFRRSTTDYTKRAMIHEEHFGRTFMIYHPNNEHVDKQTYFLHNDLLGVYHVNDNGQVLAVASTQSGIRLLEMDLHFSEFGDQLLLQNCYEFTEPVLMPYLESDIADFNEFVNIIKLN